MAIPNQAIRKYREDRGLSREALGRELGVTGVSVGRWEDGIRNIKLTLVTEVARKTGLPPEELRPDLAPILAGESNQ
jgi:transcriptional regulator with XRE-family HTH domain